MDSSATTEFSATISSIQPCKPSDEEVRYKTRFPSLSAFSIKEEATPVFPRFLSPRTIEIFRARDFLTAFRCESVKVDGKIGSFDVKRVLSVKSRLKSRTTISFC